MQSAAPRRRLAILFAIGLPLLSAVSVAQSPIYTLHLLGPPGQIGQYESVTGINDAGQIVGNITMPGSANHGDVFQAVIWNDGKATLLPSPSSDSLVNYANSINDAGQVVGMVEPNDQDAIPVVWNGVTPTVLDLDPLGCFSAYAAAINNHGLVVGTHFCYTPEELHLEATVWHGITPALLQELRKAPETGGQAFAANDLGLVVGKSSTSETAYAVAWVNGGVKKLATLAGQHINAVANAVNNLGMIVGVADEPVLWTRIDAAPQELSKLISDKAAKEYSLSAPAEINDRCDIVVNGSNRKTQADAAFLLTLTDPSSCFNGRL